ncbi:MAG: hypothetical protein OXM58_10320 [Rhodospirillaceae bacterium]|nr:hypothetical protein [Rhodospirillaceae bacterium]
MTPRGPANPSTGPDGLEESVLTYPGRDILTEIGDDPERIAFELRDFSNSARLLSEQWERLAEKHPMEWVCFHRGKISAHSESLDALMEEMRNLGIPSDRAVIRFIDKEPKILILRYCGAASTPRPAGRGGAGAGLAKRDQGPSTEARLWPSATIMNSQIGGSKCFDESEMKLR